MTKKEKLEEILVVILKLKSYEGADANLECSLFEYQLVYNEETETLIYFHISILMSDDTYGIDDELFSIHTVKESDIIEVFEEYESGILSFTGMDKETWMDMSKINQISDIMSYVGVENAFGVSTMYDISDLINILKWNLLK